MKLKNLCLIMTVSILSLTALGCNGEISIEDGKIPTELRPALQERWLGTYRGTVNETRSVGGSREIVRQLENVVLEVNVDSDGRLLVSTFSDLLGEGCNSKIEQLTAIRKIEEQSTVRLLFNPGSCHSFGYFRYGLELTAVPSDSGTLSLQMRLGKTRNPHWLRGEFHRD